MDRWMDGWLIDWLIQLIDGLINWLIDWLIDWLIAWLIVVVDLINVGFTEVVPTMVDCLTEWEYIICHCKALRGCLASVAAWVVSNAIEMSIFYYYWLYKSTRGPFPKIYFDSRLPQSRKQEYCILKLLHIKWRCSAGPFPPLSRLSSRMHNGSHNLKS